MYQQTLAAYGHSTWRTQAQAPARTWRPRRLSAARQCASLQLVKTHLRCGRESSSARSCAQHNTGSASRAHAFQHTTAQAMP